MKKLGLLFITGALTLGAFVMVAAPAAAHHGANPGADCTSATLSLIGFSTGDGAVTVTADSGSVVVPAFSGNATATVPLSAADVADGSVNVAATWTTSSFGSTTVTVSGNCTPVCEVQCQTTTTTSTESTSTTTTATTTTTASTTPPETTTVTEPPVTSTTTSPPPSETTVPPSTQSPPPSETTTTTAGGGQGTGPESPQGGNKVSETPGKLAFTGVEDVVPVAAIALLLLTVGTYLLRRGRRREG